jgi:hypothetical protein
MELEITIEISQAQKRWILHGIAYMWNLEVKWGWQCQWW